MGIILKSLKVYPIFEERCFANQIIAQVEAERDDGIVPHIKYKKYESDEEVYNYITVNNINGNIQLTLDGVNAINKDHPDPSQDIQELSFTIVAYDYEVGDHIEIPVTVKVVRTHDEPPQILEEIIYDIYQDDAKEGKIVLDVRTLYPAYFFVADDNYDKFHFVIEDFGRLTITNAGVDYIQSLNPEETTSIDIKIEIKDQFNNKVIYKTYTIPVKKGSALQVVPKKSILEQIAQYLGNNLAFKIEKLNQEVKDLYNKIDFLFNQYVDLNESILNSFDGTAIFEHIIGNNPIMSINNTDYAFDTNNQFINELSSDNTIIFKKFLSNYIDIIKEPINYNQAELLNNSQLLNLATINSHNIPLINMESNETFNSFFKAIKNQINERISKVLTDILSPLIEDIREEYWAEFDRVEKEFLQFKIYDVKVIAQKIMQHVFEIEHVLQDKTWTQIKDYQGLNTYSNSDSVSQGLIGKVWDNEVRINDLEDLLYKHSATSFSANQIYVYNFLPSTNKDYYGLIGLVYNIDNRNLENWSENATGPNDWKMVTEGDGSKTIKVGTTTIIEKDGSTTNVKGTSLVCLEAGGNKACYNGTIFQVGGGANDSSSRVDAAIFTGTATKAKYADLAEFYEADKIYEPGTVLMIGGEKDVTEFEFNKGPYVGIVSENPGFILNSDEARDGNWVMIALRGRVKVKLEKDLKVNKGQALYVSEKEKGVAGIKENKFFIGYVLKQLDNDYALIVV